MLSLLWSLIFGPIQFVLGLTFNHPWLALPFFLAGFLTFFTYLLVVGLQTLVFDNMPQNLKKKYGAEWALVTGASSG